nr:SIMPL domain-containing protein [Bordetella genomosp. 4]
MMHSFRVPSLNRLAAACCAAFALTVAPFAHAQQPPAPPRAPAPAVHPDERVPELTLQASASADVQQDTVRITLAAEFDADSQTKATTQLSTVLDEAVKRTEGAKGIQVHTSGYNVWPNTDEKGKIQNWRARGEIVLESKDFAAASALASKLSDKVAISQISFSLSREAREAAEKKLLGQAADAFLARAQAAAQAFGYSSYRVQQLELSGGGSPVPVPRPMGAMAKSSLSSAAGYADAPLEAGQVTVTLSVNGTVALQ